MKMVMSLTVPIDGCVSYVKRPGTVLECGCVVARYLFSFIPFLWGYSYDKPPLCCLNCLGWYRMTHHASAKPLSSKEIWAISLLLISWRTRNRTRWFFCLNIGLMFRFLKIFKFYSRCMKWHTRIWWTSWKGIVIPERLFNVKWPRRWSCWWLPWETHRCHWWSFRLDGYPIIFITRLHSGIYSYWNKAFLQYGLKMQQWSVVSHS